MRYSSLKQSWKKAVALFTIGLTAFSLMQPVTAQAAEKKEVKQVNDMFTTSNPNNMLGIAADFGIFVKGKVTATGHSDTNVACSELDLSQSNYTPVAAKAINYVEKVANRVMIDKGYIYIKGGQAKKLQKNYYWDVNGYEVGGNEVKDVIIAPNFINLESEFNKLTELSKSLSKLQDSNTTFNGTDMNKKYISCSGDFNVLNLSADQLAGNKCELFINNIRGDKLLIINVDMSKVTSDYKLMCKIGLDNSFPDYQTRTNFDQDAANVIWNFTNWNSNNTSRKVETVDSTLGVILAPEAFVHINSGVHLGSVIAATFMNNNEVHYVPYRRQTVEVSILSVNGDCCPSKPLSGTTFAVYTTSGKLVQGTEKKVVEGPDGNCTATWIMREPGKYYIRETQTVPGYTKTPVKARFNIDKVNNVLNLTMVKGKEANGYTETIRDGKFLIRHYSNELVAIAVDSSDFSTLTNTTFSVYESNSDPTDLTYGNLIASGGADEDGIFVANLPDTGYFCIVQTNTQSDYTITISVKKIAVFLTPVGHQFIIELDQITGFDILSILTKSENLGSNMYMKKLTKSMNKELLNYASTSDEAAVNYDATTDTCIVFYNDSVK